MPTLPNMGLVTPVLQSDIGAWGTKLNTICGLVDAHNHTDGKGVRVPVTGLNIDADLPLGGHAVNATGKIVFSPVAALTTGLTTVYVDISDNELYYRTAAGANIKMTSGGGLNISLVGGIVGDYTSVGAEVAYEDANKRFTFKQAGSPGGKWARLASGPVRIYQFDTTESVYVEHAVAAALGATYTVTWPAALPGSQTAIQVAAAGAVVFSNTFTDYGNSVERLLVIPSSAAATSASGPTFATSANGWTIGTTTARLAYPVGLHIGDTVTSWQVSIRKISGAGTITAQLYKYNANTLVETPVGAAAAYPASSGYSVLQVSGLNEPINNAQESYFIALTGGGTTGDAAYHAIVGYTRAV